MLLFLVSRTGYLHSWSVRKKIILFSDQTTQLKYFLSPPVHTAWWAHMHRFLSVCPSVRLRLDKNSWTIIHHTDRIHWEVTIKAVRFVTARSKVKGHMGQGQRSCWLRSKVTWAKPSLKVMILAGGLTSTSSCIF